MKEASSNRLLYQEREPRLPPWFVIQWTASLEKWIYWRALCRGMKVGPYLGDAICSTMQLLIRSSEKSGQKKHSYPFRIPVMKRDEKKGGGIRRAEAEPVLWFLFFLSSAPQFLTLAATTFCCLGEKYYSCRCCQTAHIPVCSHSLEENVTFDPENVWGLIVRVKARHVWFYTRQCTTFICMYSTYSQLHVVEQYILHFGKYAFCFLAECLMRRSVGYHTDVCRINMRLPPVAV